MDLFPLPLWDAGFADIEDLEEMLILMSMAALVEREERYGFRTRRRKLKQQKRLVRTKVLERREVRSRRKLILEEENQHIKAEPMINIVADSPSASSDTDSSKLDTKEVDNVTLDSSGVGEENIRSWCNMTVSSNI